MPPHVVEGVKKFKDKSSLSPRDIFMTLLLFLLLNESWMSVPSLLMQHDFLADDRLVPGAAPDGGGRQDEAIHVALVRKKGPQIPQHHHNDHMLTDNAN